MQREQNVGHAKPRPIGEIRKEGALRVGMSKTLTRVSTLQHTKELMTISSGTTLARAPRANEASRLTQYIGSRPTRSTSLTKARCVSPPRAPMADGLNYVKEYRNRRCIPLAVTAAINDILDSLPTAACSSSPPSAYISSLFRVQTMNGKITEIQMTCQLVSSFMNVCGPMVPEV